MDRTGKFQHAAASTTADTLVEGPLTVVNPGSVGANRLRQTEASAAIIDWGGGGTNVLRFVAVTFDLAADMRRRVAAGVPDEVLVERREFLAGTHFRVQRVRACHADWYTYEDELVTPARTHE
jgi:hypothetical protein